MGQEFASPLAAQPAQQVVYNEQSTTYDESTQTEIFEVTHPFHPLYRRQYRLVTVRQNWGANYVYYYDSEKQLSFIPLAWTSLKPKDSYCSLSAGRSNFRFEDLFEMAKLIKQIQKRGRQ